MTVGELKRVLAPMQDQAEAVVCVARCEEVRTALSGGEWVVVSGYFEVERVREGTEAVILYAQEECG